MLVNDPLYVLNLDLGVKSTLRIDNNNWAKLTKSKTACTYYFCISNARFFDFFVERVNYICGVRRCAACTTADKDLSFYVVVSCAAFANRAEKSEPLYFSLKALSSATEFICSTSISLSFARSDNIADLISGHPAVNLTIYNHCRGKATGTDTADRVQRKFTVGSDTAVLNTQLFFHLSA